MSNVEDQSLDPSVWGRIFEEPAEREEPQNPPVVGFRYCTLQVVWADQEIRLKNAQIQIGGATPLEATDVNVTINRPSGERPTQQFVLRSIGTGLYTWKPGLNEAFCRVRPHTPPVSGCACGLYGCTDISSLMQVAGRMHGDVVLCGVRAEGTTKIHKRGWRARRARIVAISPDLPRKIVKDKQGNVLRVVSHRGVDREVMEELATTYGARIVSLSKLEAEMRSLR